MLDRSSWRPHEFCSAVIPPGRGVRVVGDVHGDARAFAMACETDLFVVQLGDLTDYGRDSAEVLRLALRLLEQRRGIFLLGNHDHKLARALDGQDIRISAELAAVVGKGPMPRSEVVKALWVYIKKNNLQDQANKRNINADAPLKTVFGGKSVVNMFEMTKLVSKHLS